MLAPFTVSSSDQQDVAEGHNEGGVGTSVEGTESNDNTGMAERGCNYATTLPFLYIHPENYNSKRRPPPFSNSIAATGRERGRMTEMAFS
jgi:hypothetical protein